MPALPSLRQLRYLVALAELRNFTRAAEACHVTQSTLSAGLKELESVLDAQLVERDRHGVLLTRAGEEVTARARELLAAAGDLAEAAASAGAPMCGTLRLGAIPTIAPFVLPALLPRLRREFPRLRLALREDRTEALLERLGDGRLDFALIALPYETGALRVQALHEDELLLVTPAGEQLPGRNGPVLGAGVADRLLLLEEGHCLRDHTLQACGRRRTVGAEGIEATSLLTLVQMVENGLGYALVPELALRGGLLAGTGLVAQRVAGSAPRRGIALVARASTAREAEFELLAARIAAACGETPAASRRAGAPARGVARARGARA